MLLQALYQYAKRTTMPHGAKLLDCPQFESRMIHWIVDISDAGDFRGFIQLTGSKEAGVLFPKLPRTLEPKDSGTVAEFLVEDLTTIFGLGATPSAKPKAKAQKKHRHFWTRIEEANAELKHPLLKAALAWHRDHVRTKEYPRLAYEPYLKPGSRGRPKPQWVIHTSSGAVLPVVHRANASIDFALRVEGKLLIEDEDLLNWWSNWFQSWLTGKETNCVALHGGRSVCVVSGTNDAAISDSHLPKIKGVPGTTSFGATLVSAEADSFHSYGLSAIKAKVKGARSRPDASYSNVSVRAAIAYSNALNHLLSHEDSCVRVGPVAFCFWTSASPEANTLFARLLQQPKPQQVAEFLKSPLAGFQRELLRREGFYSVALSGNAGRVVVRSWLQASLEQAIQHFARWFRDLEIVELRGIAPAQKKRDKGKGKDGAGGTPYSLFRLACTAVREAKDLRADNVLAIYRAALEGLAPPLILLKPVLQEFHTALVKDDRQKPTFPFSLSRFALIKLILTRNTKGDFMPEVQLAETTDAAYNLGRLLAVLDALQDKAHEYQLEGAGVIERYYASASSAPATAFPILMRLANHHLRKVEQQGDKGRRDTAAIKQRMSDILAKLQPSAPGQPPAFPRVFDLEQQGRFSLGFYQQKAADAADSPGQTQQGPVRR